MKQNIINLLELGLSVQQVAERLGVSRIRVYQLLVKYDIPTPRKTKARPDLTERQRWLQRTLRSKTVHGQVLDALLNTPCPDTCPVFGFALKYGSTTKREECSASIDRIDSTKGYVPENVQIISWKANRIKNNATPEDLMKLAVYMENTCKV